MLDIPWPPFPPLPPLPLIAAGLLVVGLSVWIVARFVIVRWWLYPAPFRNPKMVLSTGDGKLHVASVVPSIRRERQLVVLHSFPSVGDGADNWVLPKVELHSDLQTFATEEYEYNGNSEWEDDLRVTLYNMTGTELYSITDNQCPSQDFTADHPFAPPELRERQAWHDAERAANPALASLPRHIFKASFYDEVVGEVHAKGRTTDGAFVACGTRPMIIDNSPDDNTDPWDWHALVRPMTGQVYWQASKDMGPPPATLTYLPQGTQSPRLTLGANVQRLEVEDPVSGDIVYTRQILVDGVVQTDPALATGVWSFSGPFVD